MLGLRHAVFVDANVLYSRTQRDWLGLLHRDTDAFEVFWSEDVITEALYHLRKKHQDWDGGQICGPRLRDVPSRRLLRPHR